MRMFQKEVGVVSNIVSDVSDKMSSVVKKLRLVKVQVLSVLLVALLMVVSASATAETYYFHNDHLGTPQVLTDDTQKVVWQGEYDPFGKVTETVNAVEQNLRFPGQYFDVETGLHYNYYRTYDPVNGRYVESDPIGLVGGFSTYVYAGGNPVNRTDRLGLCLWDLCVVEAAAINAIGITVGLLATAAVVNEVFIHQADNSSSAIPVYGRIEDELQGQCDVLNSPGTTQSTSTPKPGRKKGNWTAICVDQSPADISTTSGLSVGFGWGVGRDMVTARRAAEKMAKSTLGSSNVHHPSCKCTSPTGNTNACGR